MVKGETNDTKQSTPDDLRYGALVAIMKGLDGLLKNVRCSDEVRGHLETYRDIAKAAVGTKR